MRHYFIPFLLAAFSISALAEEPATAPLPPAQKRVASSQLLYSALEKRLDIIAPTPEFIELFTTTSQNLRDAQCALAISKPERLAAGESHLARMKTLNKNLNMRISIDVDMIEIYQSEYAVAEAEVFLEREKAAK